MRTCMSATVAMSEAMKNKLRTHLAQYERKLFPVDIGRLTQLQTALKIIDSEDISRAIREGAARYYPVLSEGHYLIACVKEDTNVRVWGIYNAEQITQMKAMHDVQNIEWKLLEIPHELEEELRAGTSGVSAYSKPSQQRRTCALM
jgi:Mg/Co/Ni transporter MgtE